MLNPRPRVGVAFAERLLIVRGRNVLVSKLERRLRGSPSSRPPCGREVSVAKDVRRRFPSVFALIRPHRCPLISRPAPGTESLTGIAGGTGSASAGSLVSGLWLGREDEPPATVLRRWRRNFTPLPRR